VRVGNGAAEHLQLDIYGEEMDSIYFADRCGIQAGHERPAFVQLRGSEGTFSLCTFTYVNALARGGQLDRARLIFEKLLTYANHVGLYSEEISPTGEQIGNFPQAFTHLAMIDAAITLDTQLDLQQAGRLPDFEVPLQRAALVNSVRHGIELP
jgi:GH15 family glucan-1,4-alpha-glucosidase